MSFNKEFLGREAIKRGPTAEVGLYFSLVFESVIFFHKIRFYEKFIVERVTKGNLHEN